METKYMKDKNGTIKKIKPMIVFPRHYDKTFTLLDLILYGRSRPKIREQIKKHNPNFGKQYDCVYLEIDGVVEIDKRNSK